MSTMRRAELAKRWSEGRGAFGALGGLRYLYAAYWSRVRDRLPWAPESPVRFRVPVAGTHVDAIVRCNGADLTVFRGIFLEHEYRLEGKLRGDVRTILDLGANCGYAALYFGATYPGAKIAAVEPVPRNAAAFRKNVALNGLAPVLIEGAVAATDGEAELYMTGNDSCESLAPIHKWSARLTVRTLSMESILATLGWPTVDLLKMDIEGYEKTLLAGSPKWLDRIRAIVAELHGGYTLDDFRRDLGEARFHVEPLSDGYEKTFYAVRR